MPVLLSCKDLALDFPSKRVLDGVTLGVAAGERIGIVGLNGGGKSTLLRVLSRSLEPNSGQVVYNGSPTIGLLAQRDSFADDDIVADQLGGTSAYTWEADRSAREVVSALLRGVDLQSRIGDLSGGQRRRVDLARLLIGDWDILMLDEPTNHLDLPAINWLAQHLKRRWRQGEGALLAVTHDRWFLDEVCERTWEVHDGAVDSFEGGYSAYVMKRVERDRLAALAKQKRENQLRKELAWLSRGAQARRSKPKFHLEAARALIADVPPMRNKLELRQMAMTRLGKQVVELHGVGVERGGKRVLHNVTWNIGAGERIGILGENGAGKTTLLNVVLGRLAPTSGRVKIGKTVHAAMLTQGLEELAPVEDDLVRVVISRCKGTYYIDGKPFTPARLLERIGFSSDDMKSRVRDLSGGQRRRFQLLLTLLEEPNVLLLDEPGNDLDTDMLALTEDLLDSWPGTLLVVSHDRYLLERTCDIFYAIVDGCVRNVPGGVEEYVQLMHETNYRATDVHDASVGPMHRITSIPQAEAYRLRKQLKSLERRMSTQRKRLADAKAALESADPYNFQALADAQGVVDAERAALDALEDEWLDVGAQLESA